MFSVCDKDGELWIIGYIFSVFIILIYLVPMLLNCILPDPQQRSPTYSVLLTGPIGELLLFLLLFLLFFTFKRPYPALGYDRPRVNRCAPISSYSSLTYEENQFIQYPFSYCANVHPEWFVTTVCADCDRFSALQKLPDQRRQATSTQRRR